MEGTIPLAAISSALTATVGIAEKLFQIHAVTEQAQSLLGTVHHVATDLQEARLLRRQKSALFTAREKRMFDETFRRTEEAVAHVAALTEPVRADLEVSGGKVRLSTRVLFVLRDSPRMHISLTQLGIVSQSLNREIGTLCSREWRNEGVEGAGMGAGRAPPPTYDETMFISEQRQKNLQRRSSAVPVARGRSSGSFCAPETSRSRSSPYVEARSSSPSRSYGIPAAGPDGHGMESSQPEYRAGRTNRDSAATAMESGRPSSVHCGVSGRQRGLNWLEVHSR
ncbi:hypothetical protein LTR62_004225 [Meristemomyces frigidus]|uniref:Fungal N-terminal domain-containing protein n=1 Tax=Meristemomyces frigidus TaxID=1508187 RepID=A0AAN7YG98_9PEZI|nr:hypothetical protein LTR62_004225 [Meristemomyces frigidus]